MQILTAAVIKGGTGKTTTAAALAQAAAAKGKRVLAVDLDPQASLTFTLAADQKAPGSYQMLQGADAAQLVQHTPQGIACIAASPDLATERTTPGSAKRLRTALQPLTADFDLVVIDTPPTMGELTFNALQASTRLIIPLEADTHSLHGLYNIADIARTMQRSNPDLQISGVVLTQFDGRANLNKYLQGIIKQRAQEMGIPYLTEIRAGVAIREAQALQKSLYDYAPRSKPAEDYARLLGMVLEG